jgi:hypothetical protein
MTEHNRPAPTESSARGNPTGTPPEARYDEPRVNAYGQTSSYGKGTESTSADGGIEDLGPLFESQHTKEIQQRWHDIQAMFVDDPGDALRRAGELNDEVVSSLTTALDDRKHTLEQGIANGDTEQLRIGLRQYRQMLDRILAL